MTVGDVGDPTFVVDLNCALTAEDGRILIGGDTTESNGDWTTKGELTAIVLKPGSPMRAVFGFQNDAPSADTCMAYLDEIVDKFAGKEIFIEGTLAENFRHGVAALMETSPTEEEMDDYIGQYSALMQQPVVLH